MGSSTSHPYDVIEKRFTKFDDYTIYSYQGYKFLLSRGPPTEDIPNGLKIFITELRLVNKTDKLLEEIYMDEEDRVYTPLENDIIIDTPFFEVYRYSDYIYLGYLYATKSKTGKFYESLISNIGKDISAKGIWLIDGSIGGKCKNLSLSIQLFVSKNDKQHKTYYETLGYELAIPSSIGERSNLIYMIKNGKVFSVQKYIDGINEYLKDVQGKDIKNAFQISQNFISLNGILKIIIDSCSDPSMNFIDYLDKLIINGKCLEVQSILLFRVNSYGDDYINETLKNFMDLIKLLEKSTWGEYVKNF